VAARQHGCIAHWQLLRCGLTARQVEWRVQTGRLFAVYTGVYSVGVPVHTAHGRWAAAVLAGGDGALLSHRSAAALWAIWPNARSREHVVVTRSGTSRRDGLVVHRLRAIDDRDRTRCDGIPVTSAALTLLHLAASGVPPARPLNDARVGRLVTDEEVRDVLVRHPGGRGTRALALALTGPMTRSELERRMLALIAEEGLPAPRVNAQVLGEEADLFWPERALVVELDGRAAHAGRLAEDAAKDARRRAAGLRVERFTWWDVVRNRRATAALLRAALL
jgi:very-short-patch-repair endonuclease